MSARLLQRIGCFHSDVDFGVTTHLGKAELGLQRLYLLFDQVDLRHLARVSVFDSAVQGGDAAWEGLRIYDGKIFMFERHLDRLFSSARMLDFRNVHSRDEVCKVTPNSTSCQSQHLNGNSRSVSRTEHPFNQWVIGLARGPFIYSAFCAVNPSSFFLTRSRMTPLPVHFNDAGV